MFFFSSCCQNYQTGEGFQIRKPTINQKIEILFLHSLENIENDILLKQNNQVIKIKRSQYQELYQTFEKTDKMWIDQQFPPQRQSLGDIKVQAKWKRLSEITQSPSLFSGRVSPSSIREDYRQQIFYQSSFYCTISALSQHQEIIKNLFAGIEYSKSGLYKIPLRIDGQIQEIIIDDFIPVRPNGIPLFSSTVTNQIWLYLLEKAYAKVMGGYSNINNIPSEIMKSFAWAPSEQVYMKQSDEQRKKLWEKLLNATNKRFPCLCQTSIGQQQEVDISETGLLEGQIYSVLEAFNLQDQKGRLHQVLKIRSFVSIKDLKININYDHNLWVGISQYQKRKGYEISTMQKDNIFYIRYQDFCKYFDKITILLFESQSNYLSETILADMKRGFLYSFDVLGEGRYSIQLHQPKQTQKIQGKNYNRGTIILIKKYSDELLFVDGTLTINEKDSLLSTQLSSGKYIAYCKFDSQKDSTLSTQYSISIYSKHFTKIIKTQRNAYPNIQQHTFLHYGRQNPRNKHNNDLMWISYRLFFKQGGFAFIAMGNKKESTKKFLITFDEKDFIKMNFKLKKPFKNISNIQTLEVMPGQEKIILARCMNNSNLKSLKFPPQLGIKIQPVDNI